MSVTINTFPPLHTFRYSRSWFMAFIVLLHVGFFWVLTHGLSITDAVKLPGPSIWIDVPRTPEQPQPQPRPPEGPTIERTYVPPVEVPGLRVDDTPNNGLELVTREVPPQPPGPGTTIAPEPVVVEPAVGRAGLSEPLYPMQAIRMGYTGTVVLSVQVLPNGRVGDVRVVRSSGFPQLDESALREARRWRLVPGTRDGVATAMWKEIPITFRLRNN